MIYVSEIVMSSALVISFMYRGGVCMLEVLKSVGEMTYPCETPVLNCILGVVYIVCVSY